MDDKFTKEELDNLDNVVDDLSEEEELLGDELEALMEKIGVTKLRDAFEEATDVDCGCDGRKKWLNNLHKKWKN